MKLLGVVKGLLLGASLLLAIVAFAAENKGNMQIYDTVTVGGKQLPAGDYTVRWDGSGPNVELTILKGKKVMATTPAHVVQIENTPNRDASVLNVNGNGEKVLSEIRFGGKKTAFDVDNGEAAGSSNAGGVR